MLCLYVKADRERLVREVEESSDEEEVTQKPADPIVH